MNNAATLPWWAWVLVVLIVGSQGTLLFIDSRKRGANPWFWGLLGLIQAPVPSLLYWVLVVRRRRGPS